MCGPPPLGALSGLRPRSLATGEGTPTRDAPMEEVAGEGVGSGNNAGVSSLRGRTVIAGTQSCGCLVHGYYNKLSFFHYLEQYISDETTYAGATSAPLLEDVLFKHCLI